MTATRLVNGVFVPDLADRPFGLPMQELITHVIDLPMPPSLNEIWRYGKNNVYRSKSYVAWQKAADWMAIAQRVFKPEKMIHGPFAARIMIGKGKADLDNVGAKAVLDWAQSRGFIKNDKFAEDIHITRNRQPDGPECELHLYELA